MRSAPIETPEGLAALEELRRLGFKLDSTSGCHRLRQSADGAQVAIYRLDGQPGISGEISSLTEQSRSDAAVAALKVAQAVIDDQAERSKLPRWEPPSIESNP